METVYIHRIEVLQDLKNSAALAVYLFIILMMKQYITGTIKTVDLIRKLVDLQACDYGRLCVLIKYLLDLCAQYQ